MCVHHDDACHISKFIYVTDQTPAHTRLGRNCNVCVEIVYSRPALKSVCHGVTNHHSFVVANQGCLHALISPKREGQLAHACLDLVVLLVCTIFVGVNWYSCRCRGEYDDPRGIVRLWPWSACWLFNRKIYLPTANYLGEGRSLRLSLPLDAVWPTWIPYP